MGTLNNYLAAPGTDAVALAQKLSGAIWPDGLAALDLTGATDNATELSTYAAWCASNGFDMILPRGATIGLASPLALPQGVGIDFNGCTLKALTGLSGGVIQLGKTGTGAFAYSSAFGIKDASIDCNEVTAAVGIHIVDARRITIDNVRIWKCVTHGIQGDAGYQVKVTNFEIIASSPHATTGGTSLAASAARGIYWEAGDSDFTNGACQHFDAGVEVIGASNCFTVVKCWSSYYDVDNKMHWGFIISGPGNAFVGCTADSVRTVNNTSAPTPANGGIGFHIPSDGNGVNTQLIGCSLIISDDGETLPQNTSLLAVYIGENYAAIPGGIRMRDTAGSKIKTPTIEAVTSTVLRTCTLDGGAGLATYTGQNRYVADEYLSSSSYTMLVNGSTTGITYSARAGTFFEGGSKTHVQMIFTLTNKGAGTGAVTISQLPVTARNFGGSQYLNCVIRNGNNTVPVVGRMAQNTNVIILESAIDGTAIDDADLNDNSVVTLWGDIFTTFNDT